MLRIETVGAIEIIDQFEEAIVTISDIEFLKDGTAEIIEEDIATRFDSSPATLAGGVVWGDRYWKPLSAAYLAQRPERGSGKLLKDTGELEDSFPISNRNNIVEIDGNAIVFGSKLPKAAGLQKDREIVFLHPDLIEEVEEYWLEETINVIDP